MLYMYMPSSPVFLHIRLHIVACLHSLCCCIHTAFFGTVIPKSFNILNGNIFTLIFIVYLHALCVCVSPTPLAAHSHMKHI